MIRLAVVLGDYYHPSEWAKQSLDAALGSGFQKEDLQIEYCTPDKLIEVLIGKPNAVIIFKENRINPTDEKVETWMTEELSIEITNFVENGGGLLAWHSGLASFPVESDFVKMLGGYFLYHPAEHQHVRYQSSEENTILLGNVSFEMVDEHYFVQCDFENTNVFLLSESIDGQAAAGWAHSYGAGKVCCLTPAHNQAGLSNGEFLHVLEKCVNWLLTK